jgi:hypothetical protein
VVFSLTCVKPAEMFGLLPVSTEKLLILIHEKLSAILAAGYLFAGLWWGYLYGINLGSLFSQLAAKHKFPMLFWQQLVVVVLALGKDQISRLDLHRICG